MQVEQKETLKMGRIPRKITTTSCKRLEDLEEGRELIISNISVIDYRGKQRSILLFENITEMYISNYWAEKEILNKQIDLNYKIKIKTDKIKTTPSKKKERVVFCV